MVMMIVIVSILITHFIIVAVIFLDALQASCTLTGQKRLIHGQAGCGGPTVTVVELNPAAPFTLLPVRSGMWVVPHPHS